MKTDMQNERYLSAVAAFGGALERLARGYEADRELRKDLLQEIHLALWRSMTSFDGRCSERTWVYRVAHNAAATYIARQRRKKLHKLATLEDLADSFDADSPEKSADEQQALRRLMETVQGLNPLDKQVMLLYLEDLDAVDIGEITGLSPGAVSTKVHRIKAIIAKRLQPVGVPMSPEISPNDAKTLWRKQPSEETVVTLDNIRDRAEKFQSRVRRRNMREYLAALVVVVVFGFYIWIFPGWMIKTGSALSILAALFVVWQLHKRSAAQALPANSGMPLVAFHREELIRQRDALRSVATWYLAPFIPGCVLIVLGRYFQFHAPGRTMAWDHQIIVLAVVVMALIFGIVWLLNAWGAERLQRKIDQLDGLR